MKHKLLFLLARVFGKKSVRSDCTLSVNGTPDGEEWSVTVYKFLGEYYVSAKSERKYDAEKELDNAHKLAGEIYERDAVIQYADSIYVHPAPESVTVSPETPPQP